MNDSATLGQLVEVLGPSVADVLAAPAGLDVAVTEPVVHDAADPPVLHPGDLVFAVGVDAPGRDAAALVHRAVGAGAAAVMLKVEGPVPESLLEAASGTTALIGIPFGMSWATLLRLVRTALAPQARLSDSGDAHAVGDLFALANAVAAMVGGPVTIEDVQSNVLAYANLDHPIDEFRRQTILGRRVPDEWLDFYREMGVLERLRTTNEVIRYENRDIGLLPRIAIGVRAGDEPLGSIWVAEGAEQLSDAAEKALREAADLAALHLIRHRSAGDLDRRRRGELLRATLEGRIPPGTAASSLGFEASANVAVLGFEVLGNEEEIAAKADRAVDLVVLSFESYRRRAVCVPVGAVVYVLLGELSGTDDARLRSVIDDVIERAKHGLRADLLVGIGAMVPLHSVTESRAEADEILRVLRQQAVPGAASLDEVRKEVILNRLRDGLSEDAFVTAGSLDRLAEEDGNARSEYLPTLCAYLKSFGDVRGAADALGIHPNTLRYRLRKIEDLTGIDLDDPEERFVLDLQFRLRAESG